MTFITKYMKRTQIIMSLAILTLVIASVYRASLPQRFVVLADHNPNHDPGGGNSGAIWTTSGACGDEQQDVNQFAHGDMVYINGANFDPNTSYDWNVTGQPGNASTDPNIDVASGNFTTDDTGAFCFPAYTVADDDCGEYSVKFGNKGDNYHVFDIACQASPAPSADPTATPSAQPTTTPSADPTASPTSAPTASPTDNPNNSDNNPPSPSPENKSEGQVLSASTYAPTGILEEMVMNATGFLGILTTFGGMLSYAKRRIKK